MSKPEYLDQLIEQASKAAGSDYKLAALLDVPRQNLSAWKHGRKTCPAPDVALMADIAGLDANAWLARATANQYEGTAKGEKLTKALGKALLVTGAVIASSGANAAEFINSAAHYVDSGLTLCYTMYIMFSLRSAIAQFHLRFTH